jgi:hypothetical protein
MKSGSWLEDKMSDLRKGIITLPLRLVGSQASVLYKTNAQAH